MSKFRIIGVDRESGMDTEVVIHAETEANAKAKAELRGVVVTSVQLQPSVESFQPTYQPLDLSSDAPNSSLHEFTPEEALQQMNPAEVDSWQDPYANYYDPYAHAPDHLNETFRPTRFTCPYCGSQIRPVLKSEISAGGWVIFVILLLVFFPLCWLGLLVKDKYRTCRSCGIRLG